jgi:hypothetical protein
MADETGRLVKFVAKLNRMTQEGRMEWELYNPPADLISGTSDKFPFFWGTKIDDKNLGLYVRRYQEYDPQYEDNYWTEQTVLAFCADDWTPIWEFPRTAGIQELRNSIERRYVQADSFIDKFLAEDDE